MSSLKIAVVAIGYNRSSCMKRLLDSLRNARYDGHNVPLIVSVDNGGAASVDVAEVASSFEWPYGDKEVRLLPKRRGLRLHVLSCGEYLKQYDALIVFEDDVVASPMYYQYALQAVNYYKDDARIAGISLYAPYWNTNTGLAFIPEATGKDVYFLQYAQSWGQIWMKEQWGDFISWYESHDTLEANDRCVPQFVRSWPNSSWLKHHISYCAHNDKYFVYPYQSLSTYFAESGEHTSRHIDTFQVPLFQSGNYRWRFVDLDESNVRYDAFFERIDLKEFLQCALEDSVTIDLYGSKSPDLYNRYLLSTASLPFRVVDSYALECRPHEANVLMGISGSSIFLYDTTQSVHKSLRVAQLNDEVNRLSYHARLSSSWYRIPKALLWKSVQHLARSFHSF